MLVGVTSLLLVNRSRGKIGFYLNLGNKIIKQRKCSCDKILFFRSIFLCSANQHHVTILEWSPARGQFVLGNNEGYFHWKVRIALCRNILHIRLVVCVGRDAKEKRLERRRPIEVEVTEPCQWSNRSSVT